MTVRRLCHGSVAGHVPVTLRTEPSPRDFLRQNGSMLYMVIERYRSGPGPVYERFAARGRMLPAGLAYIDSWVADDGSMSKCFQLMEASDPALLDAWFERWSDLVSFEVSPVITSAEAAARART